MLMRLKKEKTISLPQKCFSEVRVHFLFHCLCRFFLFSFCVLQFDKNESLFSFQMPQTHNTHAKQKNAKNYYQQIELVFFFYVALLLYVVLIKKKVLN